MEDPMTRQKSWFRAVSAALFACVTGLNSPLAAQLQGPLVPPDDRVPGVVQGGQAPAGPIQSGPLRSGPLRNEPAEYGPTNDPTAAAPLPCPFPELDEQHSAYVRQLLDYWESSTQQVERFRCKFNRWDYDPVFGPAADPTTGEMRAAAICSGEIKFEVADKALVEITGKWIFTPASADGPEQYKEAGQEMLERYITDGRYAFEFDFTSKRVLKRELPPELAGTTIADGPIPFIFGAKAEKMMARYWIRVVTPEDAAQSGQYWLEAYPKFASDAGNYSRVRVVLGGEDFLPIAMEIFDPRWDPVTNPKTQSYEFTERKKNESSSLFFIQRRPFYEPAIPSDWQLVPIPLRSDVATPGLDGSNPPIR